MDDGAYEQMYNIWREDKFEVGNTFCIEERVYSRNL